MQQTMQAQQLRRMAERSAVAFLLAVLCVYPLYIDKFSNLGVVKFTGVATLSWAFCLWLGALAAIGARPRAGRLPWRTDHGLWALGAVVATGVVSTVTSLSPAMSLWGLGGYYGGCMMVLFTAVGYLAVRAFAPQKLLNGLTFCMGITTALVTVLYVLNIFNIDLIGTYADTAVVERAQFFSTLGQKNFCSGFMAFALPLVFYAFLVARGARHTVFYGVPAFFGGLALAVVDADGLALGIGTAVLVLLCQKIFTTRTLRRLMAIGMFFFADAGWMQYMRTHVYTQGGKPILAAFGHYAQLGFAVCAAVWAVLFFALRSREIPLWKAGRVLAAIAVTLGVVLVALANFMPGFPSLGKLDDLLVFNDDWGTYRGTAWRISWSAWTAQPFWRKLLGVGPGMMHTAVWFVTAHLRKAAQNWLRPGVAPVTLALVSYLAHAAVSIRVSMIFPEIMLLFGLLQVFCLPPEGEDAPIQPKGKKARQPVPNGNNAPAPGLIRTWIGPAAAAVVMMAVCGAASRVVFGFLY